MPASSNLAARNVGAYLDRDAEHEALIALGMSISVFLAKIIGKMMARRLKPPPGNGSFFLFGPRGTGKSTWVDAVFLKRFVWTC